MQFTRRGILLGMGATGGLIAAWTLVPRHFAPPLVAGEGEYAFDAWLKIGKDGVVSVAVPGPTVWMAMPRLRLARSSRP